MDEGKLVARFSQFLFPVTVPLSAIILPNVVQQSAEIGRKKYVRTLVLMKWYPLSNRTSQEGQFRWTLDEFPWTNAMKIAQVCCVLLNIWHEGLRSSPNLSACISLTLLFFLSQMWLFLFFYFSHKNQILVCVSIFNSQITFPFEKRDLPFIVEIITLGWLEGKLCIWRLPAFRCVWGIAFHTGKVTAEAGLCSVFKSIQLELLSSGVPCYFSGIKARDSLWK